MRGMLNKIQKYDLGKGVSYRELHYLMGYSKKKLDIRLSKEFQKGEIFEIKPGRFKRLI